MPPTKQSDLSVSLVIPVFNEAQNIEKVADVVLGSLRKQCTTYELIIVNDGSTDSTGQVIDRLAAADNHIKAVHNETNRGMGYTLRRGLSLAGMSYVGSFPGDDAMDQQALDDLLGLIGQADVVGYTIANPEFRSWRRRLVSYGFTVSMNILFGLKIQYFNGHAFYRTELVKNMPLYSTCHSVLAEILIRLVKGGHTYKMIPIKQFERTHGATTAFRMKTLRSVLWDMGRLFWDIRIRSA